MSEDSHLSGFAALKIIFFIQNDLGVSVSFAVPKQATGANFITRQQSSKQFLSLKL